MEDRSLPRLKRMKTLSEIRNFRDFVSVADDPSGAGDDSQRGRECPRTPKGENLQRPWAPGGLCISLTPERLSENPCELHHVIAAWLLVAGWDLTPEKNRGRRGGRISAPVVGGCVAAPTGGECTHPPLEPITLSRLREQSGPDDGSESLFTEPDAYSRPAALMSR